MGSTLLLYSSRSGHTRKISEKIAQHLLAQQMKCEIVDLHQSPSPEWQRYRQVILGASIRYGHFHPLLWQFIRQHAQELNQRKTAFFCVCLVARKPDKHSCAGNPYLRKFLQRSSWRPTLCRAFAGALRYPRYSWLERRVIQLIMAITQGETDTTKEIEYTDWQQVTDFARQCIEQH